ncbi:MAG: hypothetical protein IKI21_08310 [Oscillospiraceae bacterium]|nr:hypothetical protein [Oscillospiraceae bacterium]
MENSFYPIHFGMHIILALLALLVFGLQFLRFRKIHHLILAIALPCTLLPYVAPSQTFFYGVGIAELAALVVSFVLAQTVDRDKGDDEEDEDAETSGDDTSDETADDAAAEDEA